MDGARWLRCCVWGSMASSYPTGVPVGFRLCPFAWGPGFGALQGGSAKSNAAGAKNLHDPRNRRQRSEKTHERIRQEKKPSRHDENDQKKPGNRG